MTTTEARAFLAEYARDRGGRMGLRGLTDEQVVSLARMLKNLTSLEAQVIAIYEGAPE